MKRVKPSRHHRKCRSLGGSDHKRNISLVPPAQHRAWHTLFENMTPEMIAFTINEIWLDPDYEFVVRKR
jgi:hypothetical protein